MVTSTIHAYRQSKVLHGGVRKSDRGMKVGETVRTGQSLTEHPISFMVSKIIWSRCGPPATHPSNAAAKVLAVDKFSVSSKMSILGK